MIQPRLASLILLISSVSLMRLLPHPPNFTPVAALCLFGGAHFHRQWLAYAVPLASMLVADLFLGMDWSITPAVYLAFALIVWMGMQLRRTSGAKPIVLAGLIASISFFTITNLAVWAFGTTYPKTAAGLAACYFAAIPWFQNTLAGDAFYLTLLFGGWSLAQTRWAALREPCPVKVGMG